MSQGWYLVRTRPLSEYLAASALARSGYDTYFPRVNTPRPRPGHNDAPLFPGYLFVRYRSGDSGLPPINRIAGMIGWVEFEGVLPRVPDEVVDELGTRLRAINASGGIWKRYRTGDRVRILTGRLDSLAEVLEEPSSPHSRVRVLMKFMGGLVQARVPWRSLQPAGEPPAEFVPAARPPRRTRGRGRWIQGFGPRAAGAYDAGG